MNLIRSADIQSDDQTWEMIAAARAGDVSKMRALLQEHPGLYNAGYWYTQPIHFAVREGHLEAVKLLMDAGADPTIVRYAGDPLPVVARDRGHEDVAKLLEEAIARMGVQAEDHQIHAAASSGDLHRVRDLLEADQSLVHLGDREGRTPLWTHPDMTRVLLEHGMNPNLPDWQHVTPLHNICGRDGRRRADPNRVELADLFLEFGADINAIDEEFRSTPLGWAARNDLPDMVELLLKRGANPNAAGAPWAKPLAWAERRGHAEIAAVLRQACK